MPQQAELVSEDLEFAELAHGMMSAGAQFAAGAYFDLTCAGLRDLRRLNPYFDAACDFWWPVFEVWIPPRVPMIDAYHGFHLRLADQRVTN